MHYSTDHDEVILKHLRVNTSNLRQAFTDASVELGRTAKSVTSHYYNTLRPKMQREFALKKYGHLVPNTKNTPRITNPVKAIATTAIKLAKLQAQKRQTTKCLSETARLKARLNSLNKLLQ